MARAVLLEGICLLLAVTLVPAATAGDDWKDELKAGIEAVYKPEKTGGLFSQTVKEEGDILVVQKAGIAGDPSAGTVYPTIIHDHEIEQRGGGSLFGGRGWTFPVGEKVTLRRLKVGDDSVDLTFFTLNNYPVTDDGKTEQRPYRATVTFKFDKEYLRSASVEDVLDHIRPVVISEEEATAVETKTVELDQTPEQVIEILGKPGKEVRLGSKLMYVYDDLKVVFVDGKVTDVE